MADFCNQCAASMGLPPGDLAGVTTPQMIRAGRAAIVICEGCGQIQVDPDGCCISEDCLHKHGLTWEPPIAAPVATEPTAMKLTITPEDCEWLIDLSRKGKPRVRVLHRPSGCASSDCSSKSQKVNKQRAFKKLSKSPKFIEWCKTAVDSV